MISTDDRPDNVLVMLAKESNHDTFTNLFLRYKGEVYKCLMQVVRHDEIAKDLWEDTYFKAWSHIQSLKEPSQFKVWLIAIARMCAIDWLRQNYRKKTYSLAKIGGSTPDPTDGGAGFEVLTEREMSAITTCRIKACERFLQFLNGSEMQVSIISTLSSRFLSGQRSRSPSNRSRRKAITRWNHNWSTEGVI